MNNNLTIFKWKDISQDGEILYEIDFGSNSMYTSIKLFRNISLESKSETWNINATYIKINNTIKTSETQFRIVYEGLEVPEFLHQSLIRMVMNPYIAKKDDRTEYHPEKIQNIESLNQSLINLQS